MIITIHQPEYLPWPGLLAKARRADVFVLLDDVQFNRASLQHRAKIAAPGADFAWLTIPFVHAHPQLIRDVRVANHDWPARHRTLIAEAYGAAPGFAQVWPLVDALLRQGAATDKVGAVAAASMRVFFEAFEVRPLVVPSGEIDAGGSKGNRVLDICKRLKATRYLAGRSGAAYLDREAFAAAGVEIEVLAYPAPQRQDGRGVVDGLSALDAWMYLGDQASEVLG